MRLDIVTRVHGPGEAPGYTLTIECDGLEPEEVEGLRALCAIACEHTAGVITRMLDHVSAHPLALMGDESPEMG